MPRDGDEGVSPLQDLASEAAREHEQAERELKEIDVLLRQSTSEIDKLAQRSAQLANRVRQMEASIDTYPRQDIRQLYNASQETQMRLFMMRGQVEGLQRKQEFLQKYVQMLQRIGEAIEVNGPSTPSGTSREVGDSLPFARIIEAQEDERQRLARQMHDGPAQSLTNLILQAEICERLMESRPAEARKELAALKHAVNTTFVRVREFIFDLRPMMLDDLGLIPTLRRYVQEFGEKSGIAVDVALSGKERRLAPHTEVTMFRLIQGLLRNVQQHAQARQVHILLELRDETVLATVEDDGKGFDVEQALAESKERRTLGLHTMRDQIHMLGGRIDIESVANRGTRVVVEMPIG